MKRGLLTAAFLLVAFPVFAQVLVDITVTSPSGTFTLKGKFDIVEGPPTITAMNRMDGMPVIGGTQGEVFDAVILGTNLLTVTQASIAHAGVTVAIRPGRTQTSLPITITIAPNAPLGP